MTLSELSQCDPATQASRCAAIVPDLVWQHLATVDAARYGGGQGNSENVRVVLTPACSELHLRVPSRRHNGDYCLSLDLADAGGGQLELGFIVVNDLTAPRYNIDVDDYGQVTLLGTAERNIGEELRAMAAGLGPCQVRRGLRLFGSLLPLLEAFGRSLGYVGVQLRPLTYHSAVMYERHGFSYVVGRRRMKQIDASFQPGGELYRLLDNSSPFRTPQQAGSARGRSWAIHDGILQSYDGHEQLDLLMAKAFGVDHGDVTFAPAVGR